MIRKNMKKMNPVHGVNWAEMRQEYGLLAMLTLLVLALRMAYVVLWHPYGLAPDEAQYWSWLTHNDWSFLTKPPLTTWLMGVSTWLLGDTLLGVKLFALLGQVATAVLGYLIAKDVAGKAAGWWAWALLTTAPLLAAGGLLMTPDAVLVPLWLAVMLSIVRALGKADDKALCWGRWLTLGVLVGVGGLAKYSAALFYPLLGAYLLFWRREWLKAPQVWVSGLVALAFQIPVLVWNMQNGWVGIEHVLWQAEGGGDGRHGGLKTLLEFVGGQALVLGPVVFGLIMWAMVCGAGSRDLRPRWLVWVAGLILAGFAALTLSAKVQANWPVLGSVVALVVLAIALGGQMQRRWLMWLAIGGLALNSVLSLMLMDTYKARDLGILPLKAKIDPTKDLRGWQDMGDLFGRVLYKVDNPIVLASRYQTLAPLMFHTLGNPEFAYVNAEGKRKNQYDLWPLPDFNDRIVIYVSEKNVLPDGVKGMFGECTPWHSLGVEEYEIQTRRIWTWVCWAPKVVG
ncbi:MAG: glycosyltransferase family 39 protein [Rubrivivax sp.]|nr:MAG: glycosyltransferase family 39 protein [Rubrivivax sp.]